MCNILAQQDRRGSPISPITTMVSDDVADDTPRPSPLVFDSDFEAQSDYYGLPSNPISVYHTGAPWKRPTGPGAARAEEG